LEVIYQENYNTKIKAIHRVKYLKSSSGRRFIKERIFLLNKITSIAPLDRVLDYESSGWTPVSLPR